MGPLLSRCAEYLKACFRAWMLVVRTIVLREECRKIENKFTKWHGAQSSFVDFVWVETVDPNTLYPKPFERPSEYLSDKVETKTLWAIQVTRSIKFSEKRTRLAKVWKGVMSWIRQEWYAVKWECWKYECTRIVTSHYFAPITVTGQWVVMGITAHAVDWCSWPGIGGDILHGCHY